MTYRLRVPANVPVSQYWSATEPGRPFEVMCRFFGPTEALYDKSWVLPDIELGNQADD